MADKTANIDYICVIREKNGKTSFETIDIPASTELIARLEGLSVNDNATVLDMQAQMNLAFDDQHRKPINYVSPFSYACSYIDIAYYPASMSFAESNEQVSSKKADLRERFSQKNEQLQEADPSRYIAEMEEYLETEIARFKDSLKLNYLRHAKRYICATNYLRTVSQAKGNGDVRMYSTDTLGWSDFTYRVTEDITITLGTNFGYGSASYFRLGLRYKGIDILPYSYIVKYYFANRRDLLRYTRLYDVAHDSWNLAFSFVEGAANLAAESAEGFVREWILNEVKDMVHRLHVVLDTPEDYINDILNKTETRVDCDYLTVRNMNYSEKNCYGVYPEEMSMAIRAEKLTGSLDFLGNLSSLSAILPEINGYIEEIKEMAKAIIPGLDAMVTKITNRVAILQEQKAQQELYLAKIKKDLAPHEKRVDDMYEHRGEDKKWFSRSHFESKYAEAYKDYAALKKNEEETSDSIVKLAEEIRMRSMFRSNLQECRKRVSDASLIASNDIAA